MNPQRILSLLPVLLASAACSGGKAGPVADVYVESEPNNSVAQAERVGMVGPRDLWELRGEIQGTGGEWDVYHLRADGDTLVEFRVIPETEDAEIVLLVTDEDGATRLVLDQQDANGELTGELTVTVDEPDFMVVVYSLALDTAYRTRVGGSEPTVLPATEPPPGSAGWTARSEAGWPALRAAQLAESAWTQEGGTSSRVRSYTLELGPDWVGPGRVDLSVEEE